MIFLNSASSAAALVFYLTCVCTHTDTEGKQSPEYFKIFGKNTIFNEHPVLLKTTNPTFASSLMSSAEGAFGREKANHSSSFKRKEIKSTSQIRIKDGKLRPRDAVGKFLSKSNAQFLRRSHHSKALYLCSNVYLLWYWHCRRGSPRSACEGCTGPYQGHTYR